MKCTRRKGEIHVKEKAKGVCRTGIAGIREKRSQGSDGRITSSDGEKIDRDGGRNPWGHFHCLLTSTAHALYHWCTDMKLREGYQVMLDDKFRCNATFVCTVDTCTEPLEGIQYLLNRSRPLYEFRFYLDERSLSQKLLPKQIFFGRTAFDCIRSTFVTPCTPLQTVHGV